MSPSSLTLPYRTDRPLVPVRLAGPGGTIDVEALVDSGNPAGSFLPARVAEKLGIVGTDGRYSVADRSKIGQAQAGSFPQLGLALPGFRWLPGLEAVVAGLWTVKLEANFTNQDPKVDLVFGTRDFFAAFDVTFQGRADTFTLVPHPDVAVVADPWSPPEAFDEWQGRTLAAAA